MRLFSLALAAVVCLISGNHLLGQASEDVRDDFQIAKSLGIGLTGFQSSTNVLVQDEFGVAYDTYSLLRQPGVKEMMGVSDEAFAAIADMHAELVSEIESMVVSAVYSDEYRDRIKDKFFEVESEICESLTEEQLGVLKFARAKVGFEKNGPKYFSNPAVAESLGISESSAQQFSKSGEFLKQVQSQKKSSLEKANEKLIEFLSEEEEAGFQKVFDGKSRKEFLKAALFVDGKGKKTKHADLHAKRRSILKRRYIRQKLELTSDQISKLESDESQLQGFLNDDQLREIDRLAIVPEVKKRGTVVSLSKGYLSQRLEMDKERCEELLEFGKELQKSLKSEMAKTVHDLLVDRFELDSEPAEKIAKLLNQ